MQEVAATMMLNTPEAWGSYDDTTSDRALHRAMAMWPQFQALMKEQHLDKASREDWDPLTADVANLQFH